MDKRIADKIIIDYNKKLFGFALSKTSSISKGEELASKITLEVYTSLLKRDNIMNVNGYIYRIAENVYARYIDETKRGMHLSLDEVNIPADDDFTDRIILSETYQILRREIAFLSKTQRDIVVMHYYDKLKLKDISQKLNLPLGTVKWHLFEAKNSLKEGMNSMRAVGNLGIKPIKFDTMGHSGQPGSLGDTKNFLKKRLTQNIAYAAYHKAKSINEIAVELGVSPLFIEDEVFILEEYGFMDKVEGDKYLTNIYITEPTKEGCEKEHIIYEKYAKILCDKYVPVLVNYIKNYIKDKIYVPDDDINLLLWAVITFACGYKLCVDKGINSDIFSVKRKDGGDYIAFALVETDFDVSYNKNLYDSCGDMTRGLGKYPLHSWQLNTYYDDRIGRWQNNINNDYDYLYEYITGAIKKEDSQIDKYQRLYEKGYLINENGKDSVNIIIVKDDCKTWLNENTFTKNLPGITDELKEISNKFDEEMYELNKDQFPPHMQKLYKARTTNSFTNNNTRTHVMEQLLSSGVLKLSTEIQKHGLNTIMFCDVLPK